MQNYAKLMMNNVKNGLNLVNRMLMFRLFLMAFYIFGS